MSESENEPVTESEYKVDKSTWAPGPWQDEADRLDFIAEGFACLALRHPEHGHWCGYVGVPAEHPAYGRLHSDLDGLEMHGYEVNYAAPCQGLICHTPAEGMPADVWWIGGDFGHVWDVCPGRDARLAEALASAEAINAPWAPAFRRTPFERMQEYSTLPYVKKEIERLARQLRTMAERAGIVLVIDTNALPDALPVLRAHDIELGADRCLFPPVEAPEPGAGLFAGPPPEAFRMPTHCVDCGVPLMGAATKHRPRCEWLEIIEAFKAGVTHE